MAITPDDARAVAARAECLFNDSQVQQALDDVAFKISHELSDTNPLVICVMNGGLIVCAELLKRLSFPLEVDYLNATRYGDGIVGESLSWLAKPQKSLENRTLLIVDDILDVGKTLHEVVRYCEQMKALRVYTAVLAEKDHSRKSGLLTADFTALHLPDRYVFGYGMDYKQYLRNTAGIYAAAEQDE